MDAATAFLACLVAASFAVNLLLSKTPRALNRNPARPGDRRIGPGGKCNEVCDPDAKRILWMCDRASPIVTTLTRAKIVVGIAGRSVGVCP
jgi:hypothetical protein